MVTVHYATSPGTATSPSDFVATSGTATIPASGLSTIITVTVVADGRNESNESFTVKLSAPTGGATLGRTTGTGTITNDEPSVGAVSVGEVDVFEGNRGNAPVVGVVTMTQPMKTSVTLDVYAAVADTATSADFIPFAHKSVTIPSWAPRRRRSR